MVPAILIYLLKANIALTMFFLAYRFGLRRLTFYTLNRLFLLIGIAFSSLFPFIPINAFVNKHEAIAGNVMTYVPDLSAWQSPEPVFTVWTVLVYIFWTGVSVMTIRLLIQLISLWKIHRQSQRGQIDDIPVQLLQQPVNPFSFFRHIYINPSLHQPEELPAILHHEKVHVQQWHTADALLGEVNQVFYWFNPGAWLMKTAIRENLEFITDRYLLQQGVDKTSYQYNLIKVSGIPYATAIANNFNFSHLKKRIIMMNSKRSSRYQLVRYLVLGVFVGGLVLSLNYTRAAAALNFIQITTDTTPVFKDVVITQSITEEQAKAIDAKRTKKTTQKPNVIRLKGTSGHDPVYIVNGERISKSAMDAIDPNTIESIGVIKSKTTNGKDVYQEKYGAAARNGVVLVELKKPKAIGISLRGGGAIGTSTEGSPLVLVDGEVWKGKSINDISSDKIASVDVLKGDAAKALYGSAAENGVIMIKTKSGAGVKEVQKIELRLNDSTTVK